MKGYVVGSGYMGLMPSLGGYILFSTQAEYEEIYKEIELEDLT